MTGSLRYLTTRIVEGIVNIQAERNERNNAHSDLLYILPHELVKISTVILGIQQSMRIFHCHEVDLGALAYGLAVHIHSHI
jgi:hypothetical protein